MTTLKNKIIWGLFILFTFTVLLIYNSINFTVFRNLIKEYKGLAKKGGRLNVNKRTL